MADVNYYFGPWIWRNDGPMTGWNAPEGTVGLIDFGSVPDCETAGGTLRPRGLFCVPRAQRLPSEEYDLIDSGDCREVAVTSEHTTRLKGICGVDLSAHHGITLAGLWHELLMAGDPTGAGAWKPNVPTHLRQWEVHLGGHSQVFGRRFSIRAPGANRVLDVVRHDFKTLLDEVQTERNAIGKAKAELARQQGGNAKEKAERSKKIDALAKRDEALAELPGKVLGGHLLKYRGMKAADISRDVEARRPTTRQDESWPSDGAITSSQDNTWTKLTGSILNDSLTVASGQLSSTNAYNWTMARCDSAVSSTDHACGCEFSNVSSYAISTTTRTGDSASASCYWSSCDYRSSGKAQILKIVAGTYSTLTAEITGVGWVSDDIAQLTSDGTAHSLQKNGTNISSASVTDSTHTSAVKGGVGIVGTLARSDNWYLFDLLAPGRTFLAGMPF